jgi:hypothetical protein
MIQTDFFPPPIQIIQKVPTSIYQPRKVEELLPGIDILPDTYMIYPNGGYHPFYGVPNALAIYQQPIWPYIKRIKFKGSRNENSIIFNNLQMNLGFDEGGYAVISLQRIATRARYSKQKQKMETAPKDSTQRFHRLVSLAWVPNPEGKKYVCHVKDDRTDFRIENLKWGTHSENMRGKSAKSPETLEQKYQNLVNKGIIKK